jgi:transcriptional regulator with XRE-family HTH domain
MTAKQRLKDIGSRLIKLREQLDYSREEMAAHCEVSESAYAKNERGDHLPKLDSLENLVNKFDASMDWLLFDRGPLFFKEKPGQEQQKSPEEKSLVEQTPVQKPWAEEFPGLESIMPDVREFLDYMAKDPLFKYKVLAFFFKYKKETR